MRSCLQAAPSRAASRAVRRRIPESTCMARGYSCAVAKQFNEVRVPVHVFVQADPDELAVVDSQPFQRLRHIHQLALTYLVYPGATHRRFEHCLGVMQVAGRIYDVVMRPENLSDPIR